MAFSSLFVSGTVIALCPRRMPKRSVVTSNQIRALKLARALSTGAADIATLADCDWHLLLLAAGTYRTSATGPTLSRLVLQAAEERTGYFWVDDPTASHHPVERF